MSLNDQTKIDIGVAAPIRKLAGSASRLPRRLESFLRDVRIDHGPSELLARVFIACDAALSAHGVTLSFATFEELLEANETNRDSWRPLNPTFHPANGNVEDRCAFAMLGRDANGKVVTAQAMRIFDWQDTNFKLEAESGRLLFAQPETMNNAKIRCRVTAPSAPLICGTVGYAGAAWFHPTLRGRHIGALTARIGRACGYARWNLKLAFGVTSVALLPKGFIHDAGYLHAEHGVAFTNSSACPAQGALVWVTRDEIVDDFTAFVGEMEAAELSSNMPLRNTQK
jgi:hypothetical protein